MYADGLNRQSARPCVRAFAHAKLIAARSVSQEFSRYYCFLLGYEHHANMIAGDQTREKESAINRPYIDFLLIFLQMGL